jgi:fibronectin-binding autotransporter adhesin
MKTKSLLSAHANMVLGCLVFCLPADAQWSITGSETLTAPAVGSPTAPVTSGLQLWLDASRQGSVTQTAGAISQWNDLSGNGRHMLQGTAGNQPTLGLNPNSGAAGVRFDGNDQLTNTYNVGGVYTILTVSSMEGSQNSRLITAGNNWLLGYHGGGRNKFHPNTWVSNPATSADSLNHFYGATGNEATNATFFDGSTSIVNSFAHGSLQGPSGLRLGAWSNATSEASRGDVSEVLLYNRVLTGAEIASVTTYFQTKWGALGGTGAGAVADNTAVSITGAGNLNVNHLVETVGTLTGDGAVILGTGYLTVGGDNGTGTFTGSISGAGGIGKVGTGKQTLSGANTWTGQTNVLQGNLALGTSNAIGSTTSSVNIGSAGNTAGLDFDGGTLTADIIRVGQNGAGTMTIDGGTITAGLTSPEGTFVIGNNAAGTVTQTAGSVTVNGGEIKIGSQNLATSTGIYHLSGGTLQQNGNRIRMAQFHASSTAELNVSGTGQLILNNGVLEIAEQGTATINQSGGLVDVQLNHIVLGRGASSVGTINLSGGTMRTSGGSGARDVYMAWDQAGSKGNLHVSGTGALSIAGNFNAASNGLATVTQSNGTITVAGATNLANQNSATGSASLTISGGTFTTNGVNMARANASAIATLTISGGTLISNGTFEASPRGTATITQTGGLIDVRNNAFVLARHATGSATMTISNGITQTSGTTGNRRFHVWGDEAGALGTLTVKGTGQIWVNRDNADASGTPGSGFMVGQQGNANIYIQDQARIVVYGIDDNEGAMSLARNGTATVHVSQTGGDVELHNNFFILGRNGTSGGSYNISGGTLQTMGSSGNRRMHLAWDSTTSTGSMNLSGTAEVTLNKDNANASGTLGSGLLVGLNGTGTVTVANNAKLTVYGVEDPDAALFVGWNSGTSTFTQTGGDVKIYDGRIRAGANNASHGTITVNGGTFTHGLSGVHALSALPNDMHTILGWDAAASTGIINVGGTGQMSLGADIYAGGNGTSQINVSGQGLLTVDGNIRLAQNASSNASSNASITVTGNGVLSARSIVRDRGTASLSLDGGTLKAHASGFASNMPMTLAAGGGTFDSNGQSMLVTGALSGAGGLTKTGMGDLRLSGSSTYAGDTVIQSGTLRLIRDPGTLFYTFDATNAEGRVTNFGGGGASHDGVLMNTASLDPSGFTGGALLIADNSNQYLRVGSQIAGLGAPTIGDYTITTRYQNLHPTDAFRTLTRASDPAGAGHHIIVEQGAGNRLGRFQPGFNPTSYTPAIGDPAWTEITMVATGGTYAYYINGAHVGNAGGNPINDIFAIGNFQGGGQPFAERIDNFRMFERALSPAEVTALAAGTYFNGTSTTILPDTTRVHVAPSAILDLAGNSETIGSLHDFGAGAGTVTSNHPTNAILTLGADNTLDAVFSGSIQNGTGGTLALVKTGTGTQTLTGASTYSGTTTVNQGVIRVDGTITGTSSVTVASGAKLQGIGTITTTGGTTINGRIAPGNSIGTLTMAGPVTLSGATATAEFEIVNPMVNGLTHTPSAVIMNADTTFDNPALITGATRVAGVNDVLIINGATPTLTFNTGSTLEVLMLPNTTPTGLLSGIAWDLIDAGIITIGGTNGFWGVPNDYTYHGGNGVQYGDIILNLPDLWNGTTDGYYNWNLSLFESHGIIVLVPEPSRAFLVLVTIIPFALRRRRFSSGE